jgi:predicted PhzF superfamily epimerase YddE/YHI9
MRIPYYHVNAFTSNPFGGNPAGVCPLQSWPSDSLLQSIAAENDLSETAYFTKEDGFFSLRWFTPAMEVDLCGHATLATAFVLFSEIRIPDEEVIFETRSGRLTANRCADKIELDFPSRPGLACDAPDALIRGLGRSPQAVLRSRDYLAVFETEAEVAALAPDFTLLAGLDCLGVIATAPGRDADFVSRFFVPKAGIPEDPATGSSHSTLIPFWAARLGKRELYAKQISKRGGELFCRDAGDRVFIAGRAVVYCRGELELS